MMIYRAWHVCWLLRPATQGVPTWLDMFFSMMFHEKILVYIYNQFQWYWFQWRYSKILNSNSFFPETSCDLDLFVSWIINKRRMVKNITYRIGRNSRIIIPTTAAPKWVEYRWESTMGYCLLYVDKKGALSIGNSNQICCEKPAINMPTEYLQCIDNTLQYYITWVLFCRVYHLHK